MLQSEARPIDERKESMGTFNLEPVNGEFVDRYC
jgi:hypothetical protein